MNATDPTGERGFLNINTTKLKNQKTNKKARNRVQEDSDALYNFFIGDTVEETKEVIKNPTIDNVAIAACGVAKPCKVAKKLSKVKKRTKVKKIGNKFTEKTKVIPGKGPGQSRAEIKVVKNKKGKTVRVKKDSFDRAGKFQHRKNKPTKKLNERDE